MELDRKINAILKIVAESNGPVGSAEISEKLREQGIEMPERTVRYHLKALDEEGMLKGIWKEGRVITRKGRDEIVNALVFDKIGLMSSRIDSMSYEMGFDLEKKSGTVILNVSLFHKADFGKALKIMAQVFEKKLGTGDLIAVREQGEKIGDIEVPAGKVAFGTLCSINLNGILLKHSIPVESKFGGVLQIEEHRPLRFTEMISYSGSTLDPHEVFIKSGMTMVREAVGGSGKILAGLREIPAVSRSEAEAILRRAESAGFGSAIMIGAPGQTVLGMPVSQERVGIVVPGGLNPVAAAVEWGIEAESKALVTMMDYNELVKIDELQ